MNKKNFIKKFINKALEDYQKHWEFGNKILYEMCRKYPTHNEKKYIIDKVWLIGRSYAAALERIKNKQNDKSRFYENFAKTNFKRFKKIDNEINELKKSRKFNKIDREKAILKLHNNLVKIYKNTTELNKISLASKYLHFHLPKLFYIYDSRAKTAINEIIGRIKKSQKILQQNSDYANFVNKIDVFKKKLKFITKNSFSPRQIDIILLNYIDQNNTNKEKFRKIIQDIKLN